MKKIKKEPIQIGIAPTPEHKVLLKLAHEAVVDNIQLTNSTIDKIFTFSLTLLSISFFILEKYIVSKTIQTIVISLFLLAFLISFIGILPYSRIVSTSDIEDIQAFVKETMQYKNFFLYTSFGLIILALLLILFSFIFNV